MDCRVCRSLEMEHDAAKRLHENALEALADRVEYALGPEYVRLAVAASEAQLDYQLSRLELERHLMVHRRAN
ncbi:MAG TPA: hypothetical protein VK789_08410 [Bryobacteraceae bacterium]|jgi:hypothetical protein|nr:hypothetical protein [Bryobacteraceae bacterium]